MSTRYGEGAYAERLLKKKLEGEGCFCVRSAGSRGPVDLVVFAFDQSVKYSELGDTSFVRFIQVKRTHRGKWQREDVRLRELKGMYVPGWVHKELFIYHGNGVWESCGL